MWAASFGVAGEKQTAQPAELVAIFVAKFAKVRGSLTVDFWLDCFEQLQTLWRDTSDGLTLVVSSSLPPYQAPCLEAIHQTSDVGSALDHAFSDGASGMALRIDTPQDPQDVVLLPREIVAFADLIHEIADSPRSNGEAE
jgi:hypothetical protein